MHFAMSNDNDLIFSDTPSRTNCVQFRQKTYSCSECDKTYLNSSSLRRHFKLQHPSSNEVDKLSEYECYVCSKKYKFKNGLDYHYLHNHKIKDIKIYKKSVICPLCQQNVEKKNYFVHCEEVHKIDIETEERRFSSFDDFKYWKEQVERSTNCKYSQERGGKADKYGIVKVPFQCHRSGYYVSKGKGIRHLKKQGSCKINGYCPAGFEVSKDNKDGKCHVIFTKTHIGHGNDIIHLQLSSYEREMIASKLASQIPLDDILDEIRDEIRDNQAERIHLLTKKDLYNIEQCYNLKYATVHNKGKKPIDSWIDKMYHAENSCILYYKPLEVVCEHCSCFSTEDFVLIIMNKSQCEILKKYNNDYVCVDNIYDSKYHNFHLVSLLVLDDTKQGFPCAFLISNRIDEYVLSFFYEKVKFTCGNIAPHVFMSDLKEIFYGSWLSVMDSPPIKRFYCSWHIDKAWRTNLKIIKCSDKQVETYKLLRALLEAKDCDAFQNMLKYTLEKLLGDPKTSEFGRYFEKYFENNASNWANCYNNLELGFDINLLVEGMHRSLEYLFLLGKKSFSLDKVIPAIMRFVRDKLAGRFTMLHKCKLSQKLKVTENRHKSILYIKGPVVKVENGWIVETSSVPSEKHYIRDNVKNCNCGVVCNECNICLHRYACSCIDNSVRWNMCQHIHYVCSFLSNEKTDNHLVHHNSCTDAESEVNDNIVALD